MSISIYVGNLPYSITEDSLREVFSPYGSVVSSRIIIDKLTGKSRGFGFIEMSTQEEADAAIKELDNAEVDGRNLRINLARPKEEHGGQDRNFRRGNGGGRSFGGHRDHNQ